MIQFHDPLNTYQAVDSPKLDEKTGELKLACQVRGKSTYLPALKTPISLFNKYIIYSILEYDPLLDSSNLSMQNWCEIAEDLAANYHLFDAFIILHGTDTMAYTASALSFMFENLGKTVILTGSQIPLSEVRNDAVDNLLGALTIAGHYVIPEVCLYFDNKLFRGNRSSKIDTMDFDAFDSPNCAPLLTVGMKINVNWSLVWKPLQLQPFKVHTQMSRDVACLRIFPGIAGKTIEAFIKSGIKGIVLESFGSGNIPSNRPDILKALMDASHENVIIINCTQCQKGSVLDIYETGKQLNRINVIAGHDMTPECALTKLSYLLGKNLPLDTIRHLLKTSMRGELSLPPVDKFSQKSIAVTDVIDSLMNINKRNSNQDTIKKALYPTLFMSACSLNNTSAIHEILDEIQPDTNWLINSSDYDGRTPLHVTCTKGNLEVVKILLENGALVHLKDIFGHTPLFYAIRYQHYKIVEALALTGAKLALPAVVDVKTLNKKIIKQQTEMDIVDYKVIQMVHESVIKNDLKFLKLIMENGAQINQGNVEGKTALHIAAALGKLEIVKYLLDENADHTLVDIYGETALQLAEKHHKLLAKVQSHGDLHLLHNLGEVVELLKSCKHN
eukprot:NODE_108_length_18904_cov_0.654826.p2 type:complete len:616 gc:universal NODE_108_length_18904_cov_0.654826:7382-9229(+)